MLASSGNAIAGSFGDKATFEVGDGTENMKDEFAGGGGCIEAFLEADEMDAEYFEIVDGFEQFPKRSALAIEACDTQAIAWTGVFDEFHEAGAVEVLASDYVGE